MSVAQRVYQYYFSKGLPPHVAAGFVGNFDVETSGFDPNVIAGRRTGDNGSAFGLAQWRGARFRNLQKFAAATGRSWNDLETQLDFTLEEANPKSPYVDAQTAQNWGRIMSSRTPEEATATIMQYYERPNARFSHAPRRVASAVAVARSAPQTPIVPQSQVQTASASATPILPDAPAGGGLNFRNRGQENLTARARDGLTGTGREMRRDMDIISGARSHAHNLNVGGARGSHHVGGNAADISMGGMTPEERQKLVYELSARGAGGFITYTNSPDGLHVDWRQRPNGVDPHFMHDRSADNMGRAPHWFQTVADNGGLVLPKTAPIPTSPIRDDDILMAAYEPTPDLPEPSAPIAPGAVAPALPPAQYVRDVPVADPQPATPILPTVAVAAPAATPAPVFLAQPQPPAPEAPAQMAGLPGEDISGLGNLFGGLGKAFASGAATKGMMEQLAAEMATKNAKAAGPDPNLIVAQMPTEAPRFEGPGSNPSVMPFAPGAPITVDEILASLFNRPTRTA